MEEYCGASRQRPNRFPLHPYRADERVAETAIVGRSQRALTSSPCMGRRAWRRPSSSRSPGCWKGFFERSDNVVESGGDLARDPCPETKAGCLALGFYRVAGVDLLLTPIG